MAMATLTHSESAMDSSSSTSSLWTELLPEALLANVFNRLPLLERLFFVPMVCKAWHRVLQQDRACWRALDLQNWLGLNDEESAYRKSEKLLNLSEGCLREFNLSYYCTDAILKLLAEREPSLQVLLVHGNNGITDECIQQIAPKLSCIVHLDISGCSSLSPTALRAFGTHCKFISRLHTHMSYSAIDEWALVIAKFFPRLKHLVMTHGMLSNEGLKSILNSCMELKTLELHRCYKVLDEALLKECEARLKVFIKPHGLQCDYDVESASGDLDSLNEDLENCCFYGDSSEFESD